MTKAGLNWVRLDQFAWSHLESLPMQYQFKWLDEAIETLGQAGSKVEISAATATPLESPDFLGDPRDWENSSYGKAHRTGGAIAEFCSTLRI